MQLETIQSIFFDISDLQNGSIPFGYDSINECYDNIKTQLEELELSLKENNHVS
jgi:hypothetical protein